MTNILEKTKNLLLKVTFAFTGAWLAIALSFQFYAVFLMLSGQDEKLTKMSNEISWRIDGTFKDNPDNIWYEGPKK